MFDEKIDIIMLMILIIAISFIIGLNIISVVDKKLGNVEIRIPKPNLIVNIKKQNGDIDMYVEDNKCKMVKSDKTEIIPIEGFEQTTKEIITEDKNKEEEDIIEYENYICYNKNYIKKKDKQIEEEPLNKCKNASLNEKKKKGPEYTKMNAICNQRNWDEIDPLEFYKKYYRPRPAIMEDDKYKGYNIENTNNMANLYSIGKSNLENKADKPKPTNYIFE